MDGTSFTSNALGSLVLVRCAVIALVLCSSVLAEPVQNHSILDREFGGATQDGPAPGTPAMLILDDATKTRAHIASQGLPEVAVFDQPFDSGFGWYMKSDDVFGYGTWATQQILGNNMLNYGAETVPVPITAYETLFHHSDFDDETLGDATIMTELWDGDPMSIMDTVCSAGGVSAPIPGTRAIFSGIPWGTLMRLRAELPEEVTVECDRVWTVMTMLDGCRGAWRIAGQDGFAWNAFPAVGVANGVWLLWACEQFRGCSTPTGYNAGTCCAFGPADPNESCNHADVDPGGSLLDPCGTTAGGGVTFCGDGEADYFVANINEPGLWRSLVSAVYARSKTVASLVVVSVDAPPAIGGSGAGVISLTDREVVLEQGDHNIWLEFRVGDWDPDDEGGLLGWLSGWKFTLDSSSYMTGEQGDLTAYTGGAFGTNCAGVGDDGPCETALGPGATCGPPDYFLPQGTCAFAFVDVDRPDYVFSPDSGVTAAINAVRLTEPDVLVAGIVINAAADDPEPFPPGGLYAGTLTLHVPADAKGTFTISLLPPRDTIFEVIGSEVPLMAVVPTKITVQTGRCCFDGGCLDTLMTAGTCAQMPGPTAFEPNGSCDSFECGEVITAPADPPAESQALNAKARYLSFVPANPCFETSLQVTLVESEQFPEAVGATWWVGPPQQYCENGGQVNPPCSPVAGVPSSTFFSSSLQCTPHCADFGSLDDVLHVGDPNIVPGARYEVRAVPCSCGKSAQANFSAPLSIATSGFGDTISNCTGCPCGPPDFGVDIIDCKAVIDRFINAPCAPLKVRVDLEPGIPDRQINISDVSECIKIGFQNAREYNYSVPTRCE